MAKAAGRTRARGTSKATQTRRAAPTRRISTRALPRTARPRHARAETFPVVFTLQDVAGRVVSDPSTFFTFRQLTGNRQVGDQLEVALSGAPVRFQVPVSPDVLVCEIDPRRYRFVFSPVFFGTPGSSVTRSLTVWREPDEWTPAFTAWDALPRSFAPLKRVLRASRDVTLFDRTHPDQVIAPLLVTHTWDGLSGREHILAKTALLNTYYRLDSTREPIGGERSWFSFVTRLVAIGRERLLAFVDPEMHTRVCHILDHLEQFRGDYEATPAENHRPNVPAALQSRIVKMVSLKSTHARGNVQLTLTRLRDPEEFLLDADIDESGELLRHLLDLFKHKVSGGTHPHDIHEILVHQDGSTAGFDLGYRLV